MPRVPQPGNIINGYSIIEFLGSGDTANAFKASTSKGVTVFLKQYKSPTVKSPWFKHFVDYNRELNRRIGSPELQRFCVRNLAAFEVKFGIPVFFQVFEFVEGGHDLGTILNRARSNPSIITWDQRLIMAKVIMAAINQLHGKEVIHGDLKPPNIQMIEDPTIKVRYQPKLIDMDRSVLSDRRAPWHGYERYTGTDGYFSPEHFEGRVPEKASDVFTCGIILYELLAQGHPLPSEDKESYKTWVQRNTPPPPRLRGSLSDEKATDFLIYTLQRCLSTEAILRPTAHEVWRALNGQRNTSLAMTSSRGPAVKIDSGDAPTATKSPPAPSIIAPLKLSGNKTCRTSTTLILQANETLNGQLRLNVRTTIGKHLLRQFGEDGSRADEKQFTVEPREGGWYIEPMPDSHAWTTLNGLPLEKLQMLKNGDIIALQGRKSGITILPINVKFV